MAVLVSAGVQVNITDESIYANAGPGTVPLIVVATAANKVDASGTAIAPFTTSQMAGRLALVTGQRDLVQSFGIPNFETAGGTPLHGSELNEYGLQAAFDYLGVSSRAYILRADIDLDQLRPSVARPSGPPVGGTYWFDISNTRWGLLNYINSQWQTAAVTPVNGAPSAPLSTNFAVDIDTGTYYAYEAGAWVILGNGSVPLTTNNNGFYPANTGSGGYWLNLRNSASFSLKVYSSFSGEWIDVNVPFYASEADAELAYGSDLGNGSIYGDFSDPARIKLCIYMDGAWEDLDYTASTTAPVGPSPDGTLWYNPELTLDILQNNAGSWETITTPATLAPVPPATPSADDLWVNTADLENFPAIYRFENNAWFRLDNADQHTSSGVVFADARVNPLAQLDPDCPDPRTYPDGILLVNTRASGYNVKEWHPAYFEAGNYSATDYTQTAYNIGNDAQPALAPNNVGRWVTISGNRADGSPQMGRHAVRAVVVRAMASAVAQSEDARSETAYFNLMSAPGYPEMISELIKLNADKSNIAFIVGDTPARLAPTGTAISRWATNASGATETGDVGLTVADPYVGLYYPWGLARSNGLEVMVPPSSLALRVIAYNDQVAYPWFAPAGYERGMVQNASSVGYLNQYGEYQTVLMSQGIRDVLYTNKINPFYQEPGRGLVAYGQKTLNPVSSARDRINVARLDNYLRYNLANILKPFLFTQNDSQTRLSAQVTTERFLTGLVGLRGITDFVVDASEQVNTPERIDRNELWVEVAVEPTKAVEFIYVPVRLVNTGAL